VQIVGLNPCSRLIFVFWSEAAIPSPIPAGERLALKLDVQNQESRVTKRPATLYLGVEGPLIEREVVLIGGAVRTREDVADGGGTASMNNESRIFR
jgi:hypothetical protein